MAHQLPDEQLVALFRLALRRPVRASDVPSGIADPTPVELAALAAELDRRQLLP